MIRCLSPELQLWDGSSGLSHTFSDIEAFATECRFRDCHHGSEPGCAVQSALGTHQLSSERYESYLKLRRELEYLTRKQDVLARVEETRQWKRTRKSMRQFYKHRDKP